jgi:hypothetical protein
MIDSKKFNVTNKGISTTTILKGEGGVPYIKDKAYQEILNSDADAVVVWMGNNDAKKFVWTTREEFVSEFTKLIKGI